MICYDKKLYVYDVGDPIGPCLGHLHIIQYDSIYFNIKICDYDIGDPIRHCLGHLRPPLEVLTSRQHLTRRGFRGSLLYEKSIYIVANVQIQLM